MRRIDWNAVTTGGVLGLVFVAATYMGLGQRGDARYAPLLAAIPGALFSGFVLVRGLVGTRVKVLTNNDVLGQVSELKSLPWQDRFRSSGELWLTTLLGLFLLFGTVLGVLIFVVLYMRLRSRAPWIGVLANVTLVYLSIDVLFFRVLRLPPYLGIFGGFL